MSVSVSVSVVQFIRDDAAGTQARQHVLENCKRLHASGCRAISSASSLNRLCVYISIRALPTNMVQRVSDGDIACGCGSAAKLSLEAGSRVNSSSCVRSKLDLAQPMHDGLQGLIGRHD